MVPILRYSSFVSDESTLISSMGVVKSSRYSRSGQFARGDMSLIRVMAMINTVSLGTYFRKSMLVRYLLWPMSI